MYIYLSAANIRQDSKMKISSQNLKFNELEPQTLGYISHPYSSFEEMTGMLQDPRQVVKDIYHKFPRSIHCNPQRELL